MPSDEADRLLVGRIRAGDKDAWAECIARFEGRLLAFVESRLGNRATGEDVVQETFLGFLIGLPNYNDQTPLETFLFSIAAHKLTDVLRRQGRRPTLPLLTSRDSESAVGEPEAAVRMASSMARSRERRGAEEQVLRAALTALIEQWRKQGDFERLKCMELLFVLGWPNKEVARHLDISEQAVANHKHYVLSKLKDLIARSHLQQVDLAELGLS
ncbi:MAG: RNA polymerase sigma factor [Planctomycetales bacterium]